ncbi:MAG: lipopolysaccharide kinase InaA family protein, partial [Myxococcota bacterium]|nr:lipopolysaccharide kinase InaA family protein [Myxococcota bacterium]
RLLAMEWVEGQPLPDALHGGGAARRALARALGETLRRVHEAGWVHGDCHAGNVRVAEAGPVLLDWQHARRTRRGRSRRRDLAHLEHSLAAHVPIGARLRVREAALARPRPWGAAARRALRGAGREADARTREHARSRTRHVLRPGRRAAALRLDGFQGLRLRELPEATLRAVLAEHRQCLAAPDDPRRLERDARSSITAHAANDWHVVVKATPWRGLPRALGDALRGSAGRRAWRGGHGLLARGVGAARPLAFAERRRLGLPVCSWVLLEDQRPAPEAAFAVTRGEVTPDELLDVLLRLLLALHRAGIEHGDLKGTHVLLQRRATRLEPTLIDLEGVRFPGRLEDRQRLRALAQLNASLPDDVPDAARRRAFERYARALPFRMPRERALRELVARSLERRHRWTGAGCAAAQSVRTASHWK